MESGMGDAVEKEVTVLRGGIRDDIRVLLVHPPLERLYPAAGTGSERHRLEPLSLEMIAAHNRHDLPLMIHDMDAHPGWDRLADVLSRWRPTVIGITVNTPLVLEARRITQTAREVLGEPFVVVGGNHPTHESEHSLKYIEPDMVWTGDGEDFLDRLVDMDIPRAVRQGRMGRVYKGEFLAGRSDDAGSAGAGTGAALKFAMDRLNFPVRHRPEDYFYTTVQTSRGCIWKCIYCGSADKGIVWRTAENVLREMDRLHEQGLLKKKIYFLDDCFLDHAARVKEICGGIIERGYRPPPEFWVETRADTLRPDVAELLKKAGCYQLTFGLESGNQDILDSLCKGVRLDRVREAFRLVKQIGFRVRANFMLGHFGETEDQIWDTIRFAEEIKDNGWATTVSFFKVLPLPGTPLYRKVRDAGIAVERGFEDFAWYGSTVSRMSRVEPARLDELHRIAYERMEGLTNIRRKTADY